MQVVNHFKLKLSCVYVCKCVCLCVCVFVFVCVCVCVCMCESSKCGGRRVVGVVGETMREGHAQWSARRQWTEVRVAAHPHLHSAA